MLRLRKYLPFIILSKFLKTLGKGPFENTVGQEENAGNHHFFLFPQCFQRQFYSFGQNLSVNASSLDWSKLLLSGEGLRLIDCIVFNAVFNSISVMWLQPVHLSMLS